MSFSFFVDISIILHNNRPLTIPEYQIVKQNNVVVTDDSSDSEDEKVYEKKRFEYIRNDSGSIFKVSRGEGKRRMMG